MAWLSSASTPRIVERQVWPQAEGPSMGSKPSGRPSSHCCLAARSQGMLCFFAFFCDAAPQLLSGQLGSLLVLHASALDGETLLLH